MRFLIAFFLLAGLTFAPAAGANPWTQVDSFGDVGSGEFRAPYAIAADGSGNLYVLENDMHRVQKLGPNGGTLAMWGEQGDAEGELDYPADVAVDPAGGAVFITDNGNARVVKFDTNGKFVSAWGWGVADGSAAYQVCTSHCQEGITGNGAGQLNSPYGIATDGVNVYVADNNNKRIQKFGLDGAKVGEWPIPGGQAPKGLTVAGGKVYAATSGNVIWRFDTNGVPDGTWDGDGVAGSFGSGAGQLDKPKDIAVDATGVYVADSNNHRITKFTLSGAFAATWGTRGKGNGQFSWPYGVVASAGQVWVADTYNHRLQRFSQAGAYQLTVGPLPGAGNFYFPSDVATTPSGDVYVADWSDHDIQRLDASGSAVSRWDTGSSAPYSVTPTANGIYAAQTIDQVGMYDASGTLLKKFGTSGSALGQLNWPTGSAADADGNLYVADHGNHRIQKFSPAGAPLGSFGSWGSGDGQLKGPRDVAIDSAGNIYVADSGNHRIQKFGPAGNFVAKWGSRGSGDGQFESPGGVAVDARGDVFVADTRNNRIQQFGADGGFVAKWGTLGNGPGELSEPMGLSIDSAGAVWVADSNNHRIVRFCCPAARTETGTGGTAPPPPPAGDDATAADTIAPRVAVSGRRAQRSGLVARRGLALRMTTSEPVAVTLRAVVSRRVARRLGLRGTTVARSRAELATAGGQGMRLRLTRAARRALPGVRWLRIVVRASAADAAGNRSSASFAVTVAG